MKMNQMSRVYQMGLRVKSINLPEKKMQAVLANREPLTSINREQMREGLTSDGNPITPDYSAGYLVFKMNNSKTYYAPPGTPDLYLTGQFQERMFLLIRSGVQFDSTSPLKSKLVQKYGPKIFGIAQNNMAQSIILVTNTYVKKVHEALKAGL